MIQTQTREREIVSQIYALDEENVRMALAFIAFLRYQQQLEDEEDLADVLARRDEPSISAEAVEKMFA